MVDDLRVRAGAERTGAVESVLGKLCGDVDTENALEQAGYITAVPGGIGSLTSTLLLANAVKAYFLIEKQQLMKMDFKSISN